jgi:Rap1a immunity proteins
VTTLKFICRGKPLGMALVVLTFFFLVIAVGVSAETLDGTTLLADCQDGDNPSARERATKWGTCFGYISGVADALIPAGLYCMSSGATSGDVVDVAKLYIQNHPEKRYMSAPKLIVDALQERFPCN